MDQARRWDGLIMSATLVAIVGWPWTKLTAVDRIQSIFLGPQQIFLYPSMHVANLSFDMIVAKQH